MKKAALFSIDKQAKQWANDGNAMAYFTRGKINEFYKDFGIQVNSLITDLNNLKLEYFEFEGTQIKKEEDGSPICKEGMTVHSFNMNYHAMMSQNAGEKFKSENYPEPVVEKLPSDETITIE